MPTLVQPKRPARRKKAKDPRDYFINGHIRLPRDCVDLNAFRQWSVSDDYPERGEVFWLDGSIWVSDKMEDNSTHALVKMAIYWTLHGLARKRNLGRVYGDTMRLVNQTAGLSVEPDAMFVSFDAIRSGRVTYSQNERGRELEVIGSPEMVLEVASDSSEQKDETLRTLYFNAGIDEYWLIDARGEEVTFEILRRGPTGYVSSPRRRGFVRSNVFGKSFRLVVEPDELGDVQYALEMN